MSVQLSFDAAGITPNSGNPPPIPLAEYNVLISDSNKMDVAGSQDGSAYLQFDLKIIDGPLAGRVQPDRMNLWNANPKTVEIAKERLSAYCHLTGKFKIANTQEYHGIPFRAIIGPQIEKDGPNKGLPSDKYSEIKELKTTTGERPGKGGVAAPTPGTAAPQFGAPVSTPPPPAATPQFGPPVVQNGFTPPPPVAAPPPPPAPVADPIEKAKADGWVQHPESTAHAYKGQESKTWDEVRALYAQAAPPPPAATQFGVTAPTGGANPPWSVQV